MTVDARREAWARLQLSGLPARPLSLLLRAFGSPEGVLGAPAAQRRRHVPAHVAALLESGPDAERLAATLDWLGGPGHGLVAWDDPDYPRALLEIGDAPPVLYCLGRRALLGAPAFAIVGSRNATPVGLQNAQAFAQNLSVAGLTVISGMALGIDAAAHRGGLAGAGSSIAVVGTGLDLVYPARNKSLAQELASNGLIVSEFSLGTPALAQNFPRRNRLISGLARGVLVVEAALASGSLITARLAGEQGREVFAIPGSIHSPFSKGCHLLIKQGAKLVDDANDILVELQWSVVPPKKEPNQDREPEDALLTAMGYDPVSIDHLVERAAMSADQVSARLTELEIEGAIAALPGGKYQRLGG